MSPAALTGLLREGGTRGRPCPVLDRRGRAFRGSPLSAVAAGFSQWPALCPACALDTCFAGFCHEWTSTRQRPPGSLSFILWMWDRVLGLRVWTRPCALRLQHPVVREQMAARPAAEPRRARPARCTFRSSWTLRAVFSFHGQENLPTASPLFPTSAVLRAPPTSWGLDSSGKCLCPLPVPSACGLLLGGQGGAAGNQEAWVWPRRCPRIAL